MPNHIWKDVPDEEIISFMWYDQAKQWPVTTGPYGVSEANEQYTNYDLWPSWWAVETGFVAEEPAPWRIQQQPFTNDTLAAQLADQQGNRSPARPASLCGRLHPGSGRSPRHLDRSQASLWLR
jgi:hypothetical protein